MNELFNLNFGQIIFFISILINYPQPRIFGLYITRVKDDNHDEMVTLNEIG